MKYCYKKLQKDKSPWYCRQCIGKVILFSNMTDVKLNRLMKERYLKDLFQNRTRYCFQTKTFHLQLMIIQRLSNLVNSQIINLALTKNIRELSWMPHGVMHFCFLLNFLSILASFDILALLSISRVFKRLFRPMKILLLRHSQNN